MGSRQKTLKPALTFYPATSQHTCHTEKKVFFPPIFYVPAAGTYIPSDGTYIPADGTYIP
ncbi:MAG TPA: hypothetical protein DCG33_03455 [Prevotellaceae bacterium]|nr:hypothetical protein [Prevotellaceae bacterium]